jgi:hypothetical protein
VSLRAGLGVVEEIKMKKEIAIFKVLPLLNLAPRHKEVWGNGSITPLIFILATSFPGKELCVPIG